MKANKANAFLENMNMLPEREEVPPPVVRERVVQERPVAKVAVAKTRDGLKHLGGYCDPETVEKFAILRARLKLDNSECIALAIQELYNKQKTKKAFSD